MWCSALALILFVALASYDRATRRSLDRPGGPVPNLIGPFGAWLSDVSSCCRRAPTFPGHAGTGGLGRVPPERAKPRADRPAFDGMRGLGFVLALATSCGMATLAFAGIAAQHCRWRARRAGGRGARLGAELPRATLLLLAVWLGSVSLFTGLSWIDVMDRLGRGVLLGSSWVRERIATARDVKAGP